MPRRTNAFQRLIYAFKKQVSTRGVVSESKYLRDRVTGADVEVDICIELQEACDDVIICVECTKRGRKATLGWVNEMISKHDTLPTNLLVLASGSGFVKNARKKADARGVKLLALGKSEDAAVCDLMRSFAQVRVSVFEFSDIKVLIRLAANDHHGQIVIKPHQIYQVYDASGNSVGNIDDLCNKVLNDKAVFKDVDRTNTEIRRFCLEWLPLIKGTNAYLVDDQERMHSIERMRMTGSFAIRSAQMQVGNGSLEGKQISWAEGKLPFFDTEVLMLRTTLESGSDLWSMVTSNPNLELKRALE